ncbi:hypothetical protein EG832_17095 [bacterium]|nr:hypothetical protein [bacterium]
MPKQKEIAEDLYSSIQNLPIVSPHSHVDPSLFSQLKPKFNDPVSLLVQPDHYIYRMLYSQGIPFEEIMSREDPRKIWQLFGDNFFLFRGTPSGIWFSDMLATVFQIEEKLGGKQRTAFMIKLQKSLKVNPFHRAIYFNG